MIEAADLKLRERTEAMEEQMLSPYASKSSQTRGRKIPEEQCDMRTVYQRDRDRILHCKSFRRMMHKTQVFIQPEGDHYRTRLTHTLEVAQIARTISRALQLNEDLTEAIALGHDIGHTPFGHAGERVLARKMPGGFSHAAQSIRVVEVLEKKGQGLNLTWEVLDGIANHSISKMPSTLEGQVVRLADKMAYIHHDIDDAIRGQIIQEKELPSDCTEVLGHNVKERLNRMIRDVIAHSVMKPEIRQTPQVEEAMMRLRQFMFENVYIGSIAKAEEGKAEKLVESLVDYFREHPERLPQVYQERLSLGDSLDTAICDYVSGMSDHYAVRCYEQLFVPKGWDVY